MADAMWRFVDECCKGIMDEVQTCGAVPLKTQGRVRALLDRAKRSVAELVPRESWWDAERAEELIVAPILEDLIARVVDVEVIKVRNEGLERDVRAASQLLVRFCETEIERSESSHTCMVCHEGSIKRMCAATRYTRPRLMREVAAMKQHLALADTRNASHQRYRPVFYDFFGYVAEVQAERACKDATRVQITVAPPITPLQCGWPAPRALIRARSEPRGLHAASSQDRAGRGQASRRGRRSVGGISVAAPAASLDGAPTPASAPLSVTAQEQRAFVENMQRFRSHYCVKADDLHALRSEVRVLRQEARTLAVQVKAMAGAWADAAARTRQAVEFLKSTIDVTNLYVMRCCNCLHAVVSAPARPYTLATILNYTEMLQRALEQATRTSPEETSRLTFGFGRCGKMLQTALTAVVKHAAGIAPVADAEVQVEARYLASNVRSKGCQSEWTPPLARLASVVTQQRLEGQQQVGAREVVVSRHGSQSSVLSPDDGDFVAGMRPVVVASFSVQAKAAQDKAAFGDLHHESAALSWAHLREYVRMLGLRWHITRALRLRIGYVRTPPDPAIVARGVETLARLWRSRAEAFAEQRAAMRKRKGKALQTLALTLADMGGPQQVRTPKVLSPAKPPAPNRWQRSASWEKKLPPAMITKETPSNLRVRASSCHTPQQPAGNSPVHRRSSRGFIRRGSMARGLSLASTAPRPDPPPGDFDFRAATGPT
eukprot:TRINITY_DN15252_c0_g1_i1.p1 TRINITY_DN15252_c0_g1~~TRINITY_DN15252_c0_g1_i1.p1  ORF type:complete len:718 (+),score=135.66 TRINITY_DN15252_c0_g1_i1:133-2286(+)